LRHEVQSAKDPPPGGNNKMINCYLQLPFSAKLWTGSAEKIFLNVDENQTSYPISSPPAAMKGMLSSLDRTASLGPQ